MEGEEQKVSVDQINTTFGSKDNFYWTVWQLGWYLPALSSQCINVKYLARVTTGKVFRVLRKDVQIGVQTHKNVSKIELYEIIINIDKDKQWGFDIGRLPDKQFMLDIIKHLCPNDALFSFRPQDQDNAALVSFPLDLFKDVNVRVNAFSAAATLFKKSAEQRESERAAKLKKRIANKERRAQMLEFEIEKAKKASSALKEELDQQE